jgi:hypothetical protein
MVASPSTTQGHRPRLSVHLSAAIDQSRKVATSRKPETTRTREYGGLRPPTEWADRGVGHDGGQIAVRDIDFVPGLVMERPLRSLGRNPKQPSVGTHPRLRHPSPGVLIPPRPPRPALHEHINAGGGQY